MENNQKSNIKFAVKIPANVEAYLRKHATRLLNGPADYAIDVFKKLMGYPNDYEMSHTERECFLSLLENYEKPKEGVFRVIEGGLSKSIYQEDEPEIRGVISDIELYKDGSLIVDWEADNGDTYTLETLATFRLDGDNYMIAYVQDVDAISYFRTFIEGDYMILEPVVDMELFDVLNDVWEVLKKVKKEALTSESEQNLDA